MPSDVQIEQSPSFKSSTLSFKGSMDAEEQLTATTTNSSNAGKYHNNNHLTHNHTNYQNESIYLQRYKALRDAGFDDSIANKYSPLYSSVNEVIDAILSQSLNDNLTINSNPESYLLSLYNNDTNNGTSHSPPITNESVEIITAISDRQQHANILDCNDGRIMFQHQPNINEQKHCSSNSFNTLNTSRINNVKHHQRNHCNNNPIIKSFTNSSHDSESSLSSTSEYSNGNCSNSSSSSSSNSSSNGNLILSMLKDGLLEDSSDEITLEEGALAVAAEQNSPANSSASPSSSLSSGISSFFMDTSSTPSSFSSLSSSISMTPPNNNTNNFDNLNQQQQNDINSCGGGNSLTNLLITKPNKVSRTTSVFNNQNQKLNENQSNDVNVNNVNNCYNNINNGIIINETNDLNFENFEKLSSMKSNRPITKIITNGTNNNNISFISSSKVVYDDCSKLNQINDKHSSSLGQSPPIDFTLSNHFNNEYDNRNLQSTMDKHNDQQLFDLENRLLKNHHQQSIVNSNSTNDNEDNGTLNDLFGYLNLQHHQQQQQSFFNFDRNCISNNDEIIPGFIGDQNSENRLSGMEMVKNGNFDNLFSDNNNNNNNNDLIFNICSNDSTELGISNHHNQQQQQQQHHFHHHPSSFMNQHQPRTFADIAASALLSSNGGSNNNDNNNDETFIGLLDSSNKSNMNNAIPTTTSNGSLSNGFFASTFANHMSTMMNGNTNNNSSFYEQQIYDQQNRKQFFRKQQQQQQQVNFRSNGVASPVLSSMVINGNGDKMHLIKGQTNKEQHQMNLMCSSNSIRTTNSNSMTLDGHSSSNDNNGIESNISISNQSSSANGNCNHPTNLMNYKGLWVCNVSPNVGLHYLKRRFRRFGHFTGIQTFERRATNGTNIVFVHYDNPYSPVEAISALHNYNGQDLCADPQEPLKLRFAPSMEQSRSGQLPTLEQARKVVEKSGECFNWRLSSGCHRGARCQLKHVAINKEIDSQPWVKALKKKINEA